MELINQFIEDYKSKFNYYDMAARLGAKLLEEALRSSGIRAMVTSRAKNPSRLKVKVEQRSRKRGVFYQTLAEIYEDIADLSGVRVSLYFPGDREKAYLPYGKSAVFPTSPNRLHTTSVFPATGPITTVSRCGKSS